MSHPDWLILRILHQLFEIERPKGHWSEVVVHLYCPANQLCEFFTSTIQQTTDFCGARPRATAKNTNLRQCHGTNCIVKVFLLSEREFSPSYTDIFFDFVYGFGSYVKGLPKTKRCDSVAVTDSVWFRFGFGVYVKRPLRYLNFRFGLGSVSVYM